MTDEKKGLDFDQLFPARFMKAGEFKGRDVTLRIKAVFIEELEGDKGKQTKGILEFHGTNKQFVLNKTNGLCIRGMFGRNTADWVGKRITLFPAEISYGDSDLAIRVRGSPDIAAPMQVEVRLARKKPRLYTMQKTPAKGEKPAAAAPAATPPPAPAPEPANEPEGELFDQETGEVFGDAADDERPFA